MYAVNAREIVDDLMMTPADAAAEPGTSAETWLGAAFVVVVVLLLILT